MTFAVFESKLSIEEETKSPKMICKSNQQLADLEMEIRRVFFFFLTQVVKKKKKVFDVKFLKLFTWL